MVAVVMFPSEYSSSVGISTLNRRLSIGRLFGTRLPSIPLKLLEKQMTKDQNSLLQMRKPN
jgi:hypothetical protein